MKFTILFGRHIIGVIGLGMEICLWLGLGLCLSFGEILVKVYAVVGVARAR